MTTIDTRIKILTDAGFIYNEIKRAFIRDTVRIDVDVVQYGSDKLWEKQLERIKK